MKQINQIHSSSTNNVAEVLTVEIFDIVLFLESSNSKNDLINFKNQQWKQFVNKIIQRIITKQPQNPVKVFIIHQKLSSYLKNFEFAKLRVMILKNMNKISERYPEIFDNPFRIIDILQSMIIVNCSDCFQEETILLDKCLTKLISAELLQCMDFHQINAIASHLIKLEKHYATMSPRIKCFLDLVDKKFMEHAQYLSMKQINKYLNTLLSENWFTQFVCKVFKSYLSCIDEKTGTCFQLNPICVLLPFLQLQPKHENKLTKIDSLWCTKITKLIQRYFAKDKKIFWSEYHSKSLGDILYLILCFNLDLNFFQFYEHYKVNLKTLLPRLFYLCQFNKMKSIVAKDIKYQDQYLQIKLIQLMSALQIDFKILAKNNTKQNSKVKVSYFPILELLTNHDNAIYFTSSYNYNEKIQLFYHLLKINKANYLSEQTLTSILNIFTNNEKNCFINTALEMQMPQLNQKQMKFIKEFMIKIYPNQGLRYFLENFEGCRSFVRYSEFSQAVKTIEDFAIKPNQINWKIILNFLNIIFTDKLIILQQENMKGHLKIVRNFYIKIVQLCVANANNLQFLMLMIQNQWKIQIISQVLLRQNSHVQLLLQNIKCRSERGIEIVSKMNINNIILKCLIDKNTQGLTKLFQMNSSLNGLINYLWIILEKQQDNEITLNVLITKIQSILQKEAEPDKICQKDQTYAYLSLLRCLNILNKQQQSQKNNIKSTMVRLIDKLEIDQLVASQKLQLLHFMTVVQSSNVSLMEALLQSILKNTLSDFQLAFLFKIILSNKIESYKYISNLVKNVLCNMNQSHNFFTLILRFPQISTNYQKMIEFVYTSHKNNFDQSLCGKIEMKMQQWRVNDKQKSIK